ncbi:uncharacterized protein LOC127803337 isoform X3 [Diospyros lotus]|uniref:uncharacterized protein LOC127803337 isoform X3 n=1 Tax=Diospyros lotus TaxID=55363 RepID=UPI002250F661|nr:uncharacterized protein LOC127803337 isoform X3 [Diospyros lotus]
MANPANTVKTETSDARHRGRRATPRPSLPPPSPFSVHRHRPSDRSIGLSVSKMKKEEEGETDIVGDSQTNDAVPDDSISKELDGEVLLGQMDSRGAPEIGTAPPE